MAIRKRERGGYQAEVYIGRETVNGVTKRLTRTKTFRLKKNAEDWERKQLDAKQTTGTIAPTPGTVNEFLESWLKGPVRMQVRPRTLVAYRRLLANYIRPAVGSMPLNRLRTLTLESLYAELHAKGLSSRTVRYAHAVLRSALNVAVRDGMLPSNPAAGATLPAKRDATRRPKVPKANVLSKADTLKFLKATSADRLGALWNLMVYTGLRPGEALGLQWGDVNLNNGTISVRQSLLAAEKGIPAELADPKTSKSRRAVPLFPETITALKRHRRTQAAEQLKAGEAWTDSGLVFTTPTGGPLRQDSAYRYEFLPALKRAGVPAVKMYALRHTAATLRLEAGVPLKVVSELLGHSSITLTADTYSHVTPALQAESVAQVRRYLKS